MPQKEIGRSWNSQQEEGEGILTWVLICPPLVLCLKLGHQKSFIQIFQTNEWNSGLHLEINTQNHLMCLNI